MPVDDRDHEHDPYPDHHRDHDHEDRFEERLGEALHQAGGACGDRPARPAAAGETRGHRLLLRRRAAVVAGVASVALVALSRALRVPGGDDGRQSVATGAKTPVASAAQGVVHRRRTDRHPREAAPAGASSARRKHAARTSSCRIAQVVYNDGKGEAIAVGLGRDLPGSEQTRRRMWSARTRSWRRTTVAS